MKVNDKVWCTASHTQLHEAGYNDTEITFLLHTFGRVTKVITLRSGGHRLLLSFHESCNFEGGYAPIEIEVHESFLELDKESLTLNHTTV